MEYSTDTTIRPSFNPRTREGATLICWMSALLAPVSIHAPVRVRQLKTPLKTLAQVFQSTHP